MEEVASVPLLPGLPMMDWTHSARTSAENGIRVRARGYHFKEKYSSLGALGVLSNIRIKHLKNHVPILNDTCELTWHEYLQHF